MMDEQLRRDRIRSEAERRFAQLSPHERTQPPHGELARWLDASAEHARAYAAVRAAWERLGALQEDPEMQAIKAQVQARVESRHRLRPCASGRRRALALAAGLAVMAIGGATVWYRMRPPAPSPATFATRVGEQRSAALADGSAVTLNTGTRLRARLGDAMRELELQHGEALFEVRPDPARPFVVKSGDGTVTALGTRFQVRRYGVQSVVTLLQGRVEVRNGKGHAVVLQPAQQARFGDGGGIVVRQVDPDAATGWTRGWLIFRDETLAQVVDEVNLYSERKLRLDDPSLATLPINGNFRIGDSASIANALAALLPVEVDASGADLVLRAKPASR